MDVDVFDGTVLVRLDADHPAARAVGEHRLAARFERGTTVRTATATAARFAVRRPAGYPPLLVHDDEGADPWQVDGPSRSLVATVRRSVGAGHGAGADVHPGLTGSTRHGDWWVAAVVVVPPVQTRGLVTARAIVGERLHLATPGAPLALCGRVPVDGQTGPTGAVECAACLDTEVVRARLDAQLEHHAVLTAHAGAMTAGAAARWWPRLAHLGGSPAGPTADAVAGLSHHGLPGAPERDTGLRLVAASITEVAPTTRRWAEAQVQHRLDPLLRRVVPAHPTTLDEELDGVLATAEALLEPAALAELLVGALEAHGPAVALEPLTARVATAAGPRASTRVQDWLRLQRIATALSGGGAPDRASRVSRRGAHGDDPGRATTLLLER